MNKTKTAILVEGLTEQIFVREFLFMWYDYDATRLGVSCYKLLSDQYIEAPYNIGTRESEHFYQIINVGNDNTVLKTMIRQARFYQNLGFQRVIGLRDMYSDQYKRLAEGSHIDETLNERFISGIQFEIARQNWNSLLHMQFAIMEVEAWLLGMENLLLRINPALTVEQVHQDLGISLNRDPETQYFHPAAILKKIFALVGINYDKHESDISSIMGLLTKEDFLQLLASDKCSSFKKFFTVLMGQTEHSSADSTTKE